MSDLGFNIWGAVASAIGILALFPAFKAWVRPRLPTSLLPEIIAMHKETQELLATALREGLIQDSNDLYLCNMNMVATSISVDDFRAQVYAIKSWRQDVSQWWHGLSGKIIVLRKELNAFRSSLAEQNSRERRRLASQGLLGEHYLLSQNSRCDSAECTLVPAAPPTPPQGSFYRAMALRYGVTPDRHPHEQESALQGSHECDGSEERPKIHMRTVSFDKDPDDHVLSTNVTHQLVSKADLSGLLALALSRPRPWLHRSKRSRSIRDLPLYSDKQYRGNDNRSSPGFKRRIPLHARLQALEDLVRRMYGLQAGDRRKGNGTHSCDVAFDPESLTPLGVEDDSTTDPDEWEEVF